MNIATLDGENQEERERQHKGEGAQDIPFTLKQGDAFDAAAILSRKQDLSVAYDEKNGCWRYYNGRYWQSITRKDNELTKVIFAALTICKIKRTSRSIGDVRDILQTMVTRTFSKDHLVFENGTLDSTPISLCARSRQCVEPL
jgi:hypothetical protein